MTLTRDGFSTPTTTCLSVVEAASFLCISTEDVHLALEEGRLWESNNGDETRIPLESCFKWLLSRHENRGRKDGEAAPPSDVFDDQEELRTSRRFRVNLPANLCTFDGLSSSVMVSDISDGGALLTGFSGKDSVPIEFQLMFSQESAADGWAFNCQLVHLRWEWDETLTLGCRFTEVPSLG